MRVAKLIASVAIVLTLGAAPSPPAKPTPLIVFRHVAVLPMDRDVLLQDQRVVVRGSTIVSVAPDTAAPGPSAAQIIDGRGAVLMPGLVDFHTHAEGWNELPSFVAGGITTIATLDGETLTGRWRDGAALPHPNFIAGSEILDGTPPTNRRFYAVTAEHAGQIVAQERQRGADFLKIYGKLKEPALSALLAAARAQNIAVGGHIPRGADLKALFDGGYSVVAHGEEYLQYIMPDPTPQKIAAVADITAAAGVAVVPNLVGYTVMPRQAAALPQELAQPDVALLSSAVYDEWLPRRNRYATRDKPTEFAKRVSDTLPVLQALTKALYDRHVLLLAGTDAPTLCLPETCLHEDIELLSASGLGDYQALRAATVNAGIEAARMVHGKPRFGIVAPGMRADLVLLPADRRGNLQALHSPKGVMVNGRWMDAGYLAVSKDKVRKVLAPRHALIDQYEQMIVAKDLKPLFAFIDRRIPPRSEILNQNVMIFDALELEEAGRRSDAIKLLDHGAPTFQRVPGLWNVLGRMKAEAGDRAGARVAYERARSYRPWDGVALAGLAALRKPDHPQASP